MCLGFTESWLHSGIVSPLIDIEGYVAVRLDRQTGKRGGGQIFYIREDLDWELLTPGISSRDIETISIIIKRNYPKNICITLVYILPNAIDRCT